MGTIYLLSTNYILRFSFSMGGISVRLSFTLISASHSPAIMWYSQIMLVRLSPASPQSWKCVSSFLRTSHFHKPVNWHAIQVDKPRLFKIDLRENPYSIGSVIQIVKQLLFGRSSEIRKVKRNKPSAIQFSKLDLAFVLLIIIIIITFTPFCNDRFHLSHSAWPCSFQLYYSTMGAMRTSDGGSFPARLS